MLRTIKRIIKSILFSGSRGGGEIYPDEIILEAHNIPGFNTFQMEGRLIKILTWKNIVGIGLIFVILLGFFVSRAWFLQINKGDLYFGISQNNHLRYTPVFAERGVIYDRNEQELVWNEREAQSDFLLRKYSDLKGVSHVLGFVKYPSKDKHGFYFRDDYQGIEGVEENLDSLLKGKNGLKILEVNALNSVVSENLLENPEKGEDVYLSIDSKLSDVLYGKIKELAERVGFKGGAGVIMDVETGEILVLSSYPEYNSQVMTNGSPSEEINKYSSDQSKPFLNRITQGVYTPGSIVKPFMSISALNERIISPEKQILSTGSISIQNEYYPDLKTVFKDWKAHGWVDMRKALAYSSNVYFYTIGGGYEDQKGLGITNIKKYFEMFGFGKPLKDDFFSGASGVIPDPEWKAKNFDGDDWRLGDTYHTSIGQYGFQVTPIQVVRAISAIANDGILVNPTIIKQKEGEDIKMDAKNSSKMDIPSEYFKVVKEGMRMGVKEGTGSSLSVPFVEVAAKSGTAELGTSKKRTNAWMVGFFPYQKPKYAFAVVMEDGPVENLVGGGYVMRQVLEWMNVYTPEYFKY